MATFEDTVDSSTGLLASLAPEMDAARSLACSYAAPDCEGWEQLWDKHGIIASKRKMDGNKICVRGLTNYPHPPLEVFKLIQDVPRIDDNIARHDFLARLSPSVVIDRVCISPPWPVSPRDGLSVTFIDMQEDGTLSQISFGHSNDEVYPPQAGVIRSELAITAFVLQPDGQGGTNVAYMLQMDPMGSIPGFLKTKMTGGKPMVLHTLRGLLDKSPPPPPLWC